MNNKKRHPLACKCCTYDGGGHPVGEYAVWDDTASGHQGRQLCIFPSYWEQFYWGPGRGGSGSHLWYLFHDKQYHGAHTAVLAFSPFMSMTGIPLVCLRLYGFPSAADTDRRGCRMALDPV